MPIHGCYYVRQDFYFVASLSRRLIASEDSQHALLPCGHLRISKSIVVRNKNILPRHSKFWNSSEPFPLVRSADFIYGIADSYTLACVVCQEPL